MNIEMKRNFFFHSWRYHSSLKIVIELFKLVACLIELLFNYRLSNFFMKGQNIDNIDDSKPHLFNFMAR